MKKIFLLVLALCLFSSNFVYASEEYSEYGISDDYYWKEWGYYVKETSSDLRKTNRISVSFYDFSKSEEILENVLSQMNYEVERIVTDDNFWILLFDSLEEAEEAFDRLYYADEVKWVNIDTRMGIYDDEKAIKLEIFEICVPFVIKSNETIKLEHNIKACNVEHKKAFALYSIQNMSDNLLRVSEHVFKTVSSGNSIVSIREVTTDKDLEVEFVVDNVDLNSSFNDISDYKLKNSIERVSENGLMTGKSDGLFAPDDKLSIEEFMTIWSRLNYDIEPRLRRDLNIELITSEWSKNYVKNVLNRMTPEQVETVFGNSLDATKPITGELVSYLLALENDNVVNESDFKFEDNITRAEIAVLLDRMI